MAGILETPKCVRTLRGEERLFKNVKGKKLRKKAKFNMNGEQNKRNPIHL